MGILKIQGIPWICRGRGQSYARRHGTWNSLYPILRLLLLLRTMEQTTSDLLTREECIYTGCYWYVARLVIRNLVNNKKKIVWCWIYLQIGWFSLLLLAWAIIKVYHWGSYVISDESHGAIHHTRDKSGKYIWKWRYHRFIHISAFSAFILPPRTPDIIAHWQVAPPARPPSRWLPYMILTEPCCSFPDSPNMGWHNKKIF